VQAVMRLASQQQPAASCTKWTTHVTLASAHIAFNGYQRLNPQGLHASAAFSLSRAITHQLETEARFTMMLHDLSR